MLKTMDQVLLKQPKSAERLQRYTVCKKKIWHKETVRLGKQIMLISPYLLDNMSGTHADVMVWKHLLHYRSFVRGILKSLVDFTHRGSLIWSFVFYVVRPHNISELTVEWLVNWDVIVLMWCNYNEYNLSLLSWIISRIIKYGGTRIQDINNNTIDLVMAEYSNSSTGRV